MVTSAHIGDLGPVTSAHFLYTLALSGTAGLLYAIKTMRINKFDGKHVDFYSSHNKVPVTSFTISNIYCWIFTGGPLFCDSNRRADMYIFKTESAVILFHYLV